MPTTNKIIPLNSIERLQVVKCEGDVSVIMQRWINDVNADSDDNAYRFRHVAQFDVTQEQAVGLAMALLEGTEFKITR